MLTQEYLKSILSYDQESGIFTWIKCNKYWLNGTNAGTICKGYVRININGKLYFAHRLAWLYVYGEFPNENIDHINMVRNDNRLENLREATFTQNGYNRLKLSNNKTGYKGVSLIKNGKYKAQSFLNGNLVYLGIFKTPEEASTAYKLYAKSMHGEFYNDPD